MELVSSSLPKATTVRRAPCGEKSLWLKASGSEEQLNTKIPEQVLNHCHCRAGLVPFPCDAWEHGRTWKNCRTLPALINFNTKFQKAISHTRELIPGFQRKLKKVHKKWIKRQMKQAKMMIPGTSIVHTKKYKRQTKGNLWLFLFCVCPRSFVPGITFYLPFGFVLILPLPFWFTLDFKISSFCRLLVNFETLRSPMNVL